MIRIKKDKKQPESERKKEVRTKILAGRE